MATIAAGPEAASTIRRVERLITGEETEDGAGVRLRRLIGTPALSDLDPFLLMDEFRSDEAADYIAGFPEHPHRGFETVTYMLAGRMRHGDNQGNKGLLTAGSVQWMTAGRGIVHSEMPEQEEGLIWGFQIWINLPAAEKMTAPRYQDIPPEDIPVVEEAGVRVKVIAGSFGGVAGPVAAKATEPRFFDISLPRGAGFEESLPAQHTAFLYVIEGQVQLLSGGHVPARRLAVLGPGDRISISAREEPARFLLIAGRPLKETVSRLGPFVMNTPQEIRDAIDDFRAGRF